MASRTELLRAARRVLERNDRGGYTIPSESLYPHQWLWDSCFIAIGLSHIEPRRAARELLSLMRGQWSNGMLPHIIFSDNPRYWYGPSFWQTHGAPNAPAGVETSGMTQPPMPAIAAAYVAKRLSGADARKFLQRIYPRLVAYHSWIYRERDPGNTGLAVLVSPWESGMDNTPPWAIVLKHSHYPSAGLDSWWLKARRRLWQDAKRVPIAQRTTDSENMQLRARALSFRRRHYNSQLQMLRSRILVEDLIFNCILIAANRALKKVAKAVRSPLPDSLTGSMRKTPAALETLWDELTGEYYPRDYRNQKALKLSSIATFMPLFSGAIDHARAARLVKQLKNPWRYATDYLVPTTPLDSPLFNDQRYWRGPVWLNTNWLIIKGLKQYGFDKEAQALTKRTLELVSKSGFWEYFSPLDGHGYGSQNFSWTAALTIDLLKS